jgi:hypothetical protein
MHLAAVTLVFAVDGAEPTCGPVTTDLTARNTDVLLEVGDFVPWVQFSEFFLDEATVVPDDEKRMCKTRSN